MQAEDFEYDGEYLKDWGYSICRIDSSSGFDTIDSDSQLSFSNTLLTNGKEMPLTVSQYENRVEITFCIYKSFCHKRKPIPITVQESSKIKRWLNRPTFHKFKLIQPDWSNIYMNGSFNVNNIEVNGLVYLLELTFVSDRPFALHEPITYNIITSKANESYSIYDISDEIGYLYPTVTLKCLESGDLKISNSNDGRVTMIKNCQKNEIITFSPELYFSTSSLTHKIQNDFNYNFLRISNNYRDRKNVLTFSLPVECTITYSPIIKAVQ